MVLGLGITVTGLGFGVVGEPIITSPDKLKLHRI